MQPYLFLTIHNQVQRSEKVIRIRSPVDDVVHLNHAVQALQQFRHHSLEARRGTQHNLWHTS